MGQGSWSPAKLSAVAHVSHRKTTQTYLAGLQWRMAKRPMYAGQHRNDLEGGAIRVPPAKPPHQDSPGCRRELVPGEATASKRLASTMRTVTDGEYVNPCVRAGSCAHRQP